MRLWWPALGATVAVALSVGLASGVWQATSAEQPTSLAAMIENLADPGSNRNPQRLDAAMYLPRVLDDGVALDGAMLAQHAGDSHQDEVVAVAATVTREGTIGDYALLEQVGARHMLTPSGIAADDEMQGVLHAVRQSRFAPAQRPGGQVVAVNMVWLFARTTVKASHQTVDLGMPLTRPVLAAPPPAAKPAGLARPKAPAPAICRRSSRPRRSNQRPPEAARRGRGRVSGRLSEATPRALDTLLSASAARSTTPCAPCASGNVSSILLDARVGDAVLRIHRLPPVAVERVLDLQHRRVVVAHVEGEHGAGAVAARGRHRDRPAACCRCRTPCSRGRR